MPISKLSKYIILFLFAVLIVLSGLLAVYGAENKALQKANAVLKEQVALRDAAISEIDKNIEILQQQVSEAEQICDERLKARNDVLLLLHNKSSPANIQPAASLNKEQETESQIKQVLDDLVRIHNKIMNYIDNQPIDEVDTAKINSLVNNAKQIADITSKIKKYMLEKLSEEDKEAVQFNMRVL